MTMRTKIARLFTIKTRFEAYLVTYAISVGAVERGLHYAQDYPGNGGILLAIACLLALAPACAQDRAKSEVKSTNKNNSDRVKEQTQSEKGQAHPDQVAIPECLRKLNLCKRSQSGAMSC